MHNIFRKALQKVGFRYGDWGDWRGLNVPEQLPRYDFIEQLRIKYKPAGSILDLGTGEGILLERIHNSPYSCIDYHGIDQSKEAISIAKSKILHAQCERFTCGDIRDLSLVRSESYDLIVFSEVLYYLPNPRRDSVELMQRYEDFLNEDGLFLVSIWHDRAKTRTRNEATWKSVNAAYASSCLISAFIRSDENRGWGIALYSPATKHLSRVLDKR